MFTAFTGWFIIALYVLFLAALIVALYFLIRLAVLHALKAHSRWIDLGKP